MKSNLAIFEDYKIRRLYDEETETWFFFGGGYYSGFDTAAGFPGCQKLLESLKK